MIQTAVKAQAVCNDLDEEFTMFEEGPVCRSLSAKPLINLCIAQGEAPQTRC